MLKQGLSASSKTRSSASRDATVYFWEATPQGLVTGTAPYKLLLVMRDHRSAGSVCPSKAPGLVHSQCGCLTLCCTQDARRSCEYHGTSMVVEARGLRLLSTLGMQNSRASCFAFFSPDIVTSSRASWTFPCPPRANDLQIAGTSTRHPGCYAYQPFCRNLRRLLSHLLHPSSHRLGWRVTFRELWTASPTLYSRRCSLHQNDSLNI